MPLYYSLKLVFLDVKENIILGLLSRIMARSSLSCVHSNTDDLLQDIGTYERIDKSRADHIETECRGVLSPTS